MAIRKRKSKACAVLAIELIQLKLDAIVTAGTTATRAVKATSVTIPIVMSQDDAPIGNGFVASLARPQGNITGLSTLEPEVSGKEVELLKEIIPTLARVAVFQSKDAKMLDEIKRAATGMKVQIDNLDISSAKAIEPAFQAATKTHAEAALWTVSGSITRTYHPEVVNSRSRTDFRSFTKADNGRKTEV